ncbi:glycosyl hydrolase family 18 protein [Streptomyces sp. TLI_171]|uniref:glycosyl hydrolase family 18 protein n=1 Tax=Streptomyces sp. TLI_171 TaxID=1938859 RepID=UPI000C18AE70|nr:glycosyl hydrolase family 18 protein [Streptomyces sp. TLI_171]RKE18480.1 chitinase [Streptomyces sp. TLI_171]
MLERATPATESTRRRAPSRRRAGALAVAAAMTVGSTALALSLGTASAAAVNLLGNADFEAGSLTGWTCTNGSVVTTPVHGGSYALNGNATASDTGQCQQTVTVQPNTKYTLAGWVKGSYVYLGATGTGVNASTWTPNASAYTQLSTSFTTGASTTSVTVFTHGWYGTGAYQADDLTLTGPATTSTTPSASASASASAGPSTSASPSRSTSPSPSTSASPSPSASSSSGTGNGPAGDGKITVPGGVTVTRATSNAVVLKWNASTDSTDNYVGYKVWSKGQLVGTSMGTGIAISSLLPNTAYTFTVQAYDKAGHASQQSAAVTTSTAAASTAKPLKSAYFDQWSVYDAAYYPKNVDTSGAGAKLDVISYAFENIHPTNLNCFEAVKASDASHEDNPNAGDGAADAYADYQMDYSGAISVDGSTDDWQQPLKGNFNQLRQLKAKNPNLRITLSLGGWTYSKYFSDAAATDASRKKLVSSCIDMFLKGNLPTGVAGDASGGAASAAGIFDGIDIDWEYPGSAGGHTGNHYSAADKQNFTALLAEFRSQLDGYGATVGKKFLLTAALPSGQDKIQYIETDKIGAYLDYADIMTYDMHGSWDATGPTNLQDPLHDSPADPTTPIAPGTRKYNVDTTLAAYTTGLPEYGIAGGFPANKIILGVPFYWRGWTGVQAGNNFGLYQTATGATPAKPGSQEAGLASWRELTLTAQNTHWDPVTESTWVYDGTNFWTGDNPQAIQARAAYAKSKGLGGMFAFALENDDDSSTLLNSIYNSLG